MLNHGNLKQSFYRVSSPSSVLEMYFKLAIGIPSRQMSIVFIEIGLTPEVTGVVIDGSIVPMTDLPAGYILHELRFVVTVFHELSEEHALLLGNQERR